MLKRLLFVLVIIILVLCTGCIRYDKNNPSNFPETKWQSTDKSITIYIKNSKRRDIFGSIVTDENIIDIYAEFLPEERVLCYKASDYWSDRTVPCLEVWQMECSKGKFVITVEETTYFEVGEEITFELVEENVDINEIPYPEKPETQEPQEQEQPQEEKTQSDRVIVCNNVKTMIGSLS